MNVRRLCGFIGHLVVVGLIIGLAVAPPAHAGGFSKALMSRLFKRDLANHAATAAKPLTKPLTVQRYTSRAQAKREVKAGIATGTHMTPNAARGRPLSPESAQRRYGLSKPPEVRETVRLPAGQPVRHNKAQGGEPGRGELTSNQPVPKGAVTKVVPLQ